MSNSKDLDKKQRIGMRIILAYPFVVLFFGAALNFFAFNVNPFAVSLPSEEAVHALIIAAVLLVINHTWLMTSTELVRARFKMYSTPEEWAASGTDEKEASELGVRELKRRHDAHNNATENVVYFVLLSLMFSISSPTAIAVQVWVIGFAIARLGFTYCYLTGKDDIRGLFMTLALLAIYGMASSLLISIFI